MDKCGNISDRIMRKLIWHIFFFKVHLLAHQRRDGAGVGVEGLCSRWRSLLVPSGVRSGTATGDSASGEDTKTFSHDSSY